MPSRLLGPAGAARGSIRLPGSKSLSNRVLLLSAVAAGDTLVRGLLDADDTRVMRDALARLGVQISAEENALRVAGSGGPFPAARADLFLGNAGTAFRPLTALLAVCGGEYRLSGVPRMHERPIGDLVEPLRAAGARIDYLGKEGYPPLRIRPAALSFQRPLHVRGATSSQFLSALLMAPAVVGSQATIEVQGELISKPYVELTLATMRRFGVAAQREHGQRFHVPAGRYRSPGEIYVEGDASAASYFLAAGAIGGGPVRVEGVGRGSLQGDVRFTEVLERMGARVALGEGWIEVRAADASRRLKAFDLDLNPIPDAAMTAAVLALFADGPCTIRNVASWRVKETDRLAAMAAELAKFGAAVTEGPDFLRIAPPQGGLPDGVAVDTYDDHRIAMCFALTCLGGVSVRINDPECVAKTYPQYFADFSRLIVPA